MAVENSVQVFHKPDWHKSQTPLMGEIVGQVGYVTDQGTIKIIGDSLKEVVSNSRYDFESDDNSPTLMFSAQSSFI